MKIAFSARGLSISSGGVKEYIKSLIPALCRQRKDDELIIFYNTGEFTDLAPDCQQVVIGGGNRILWDFFKFPGQLRKLGVDAAIFPKNVIPFRTNCRNFVVVHDMAYFDRKLGAYPLADTVYMKTLIPRSVCKANGVFAISENTKKEILRYTQCSPDKITVTYEAADSRFRPISDSNLLEGVKARYSLPERFVLYTGSLSPRKNIKTLLKALAEIRNKVPHKLVLTASKSWKDSDVYKLMQDLELEDRIHIIGYAEDDDMPALYNLADAYVYPSLYEGFGLPVLEAMQSGCPVVASNATSIPEVVGDAGILLDPLRVSLWAENIYNVLCDEQLREKLINSGLKQADKFSWDRTAEAMLNAIRNDINR